MPLATQEFLEIEEIKEGIVILKNKALRTVLNVSSLNFALKSEEEQKAIIYQFQNFLNSLDFPLEIIVQSRKVNLTGYLDLLKDLEEKQENELLKLQTSDYREFIRELIAGSSIMTKNFYVIVPFSLGEIIGFAQTKEFLKGKIPTLTEEIFERLKNQLWQRTEFVALGLRRCGLEVRLLDTAELIDFFWGWHHVEETEVGYHPEIPPELLR